MSNIFERFKARVDHVFRKIRVKTFAKKYFAIYFMIGKKVLTILKFNAVIRIVEERQVDLSSAFFKSYFWSWLNFEKKI
jgi:hypothetical protein